MADWSKKVYKVWQNHLESDYWADTEVATSAWYAKAEYGRKHNTSPHNLKAKKVSDDGEGMDLKAMERRNKLKSHAYGVFSHNGDRGKKTTLKQLARELKATQLEVMELAFEMEWETENFGKDNCFFNVKIED